MNNIETKKPLIEKIKELNFDLIDKFDNKEEVKRIREEMVQVLNNYKKNV